MANISLYHVINHILYQFFALDTFQVHWSHKFYSISFKDNFTMHNALFGGYVLYSGFYHKQFYVQNVYFIPKSVFYTKKSLFRLIEPCSSKNAFHTKRHYHVPCIPKIIFGYTQHQSLDNIKFSLHDHQNNLCILNGKYTTNVVHWIDTKTTCISKMRRFNETIL